MVFSYVTSSFSVSRGSSMTGSRTSCPTEHRWLLWTDTSQNQKTFSVAYHKVQQCFPYIDHCVARRHRINIERHELIWSFFFFSFFNNAIWKSKNRSVHSSPHSTRSPCHSRTHTHTHTHTRSESDDTLTHEPTDVTRRLATGHAGVDKLPDYCNYYGVIITKT